MINIISFSGKREKGNCYDLMQFMSNSLIDKKIAVNEINFKKLNIHNCTNCNYECFSTGCPYLNDAEELLNLMIEASLNFLIVPIYCDFPSSQLFVLNERIQCSTSYQQKNPKNKVILITNTNIEINRNIIKTMFNIENQDILILSPHEYGMKSMEGILIQNSQVKDKLMSFIEADCMQL